MVGRCGQIRVVIRGALRQSRNRERCELARAVCGVVFFLCGSVVVETKIGEIRRRVASDAVSGVLRSVDGAVRGAEENLQPCQLCGAKRKRLGVKLEFAKLAVDKLRI